MGFFLMMACVKVGGGGGPGSGRGQCCRSGSGGGGGEEEPGGREGGAHGDAGELHWEGANEDRRSEAQGAALCESTPADDGGPLQIQNRFLSNVAFLSWYTF